MNIAADTHTASTHWHRFRRQLRGLKGTKRRVAVELHTLAGALGEPVIEMMLVCAKRAATGGDRECLDCTLPWSLDRGIAGMGLTVIRIKNIGNLFALFGDCMGAADPITVLGAAAQRDFQLTDLAMEAMPQVGGA